MQYLLQGCPPRTTGTVPASNALKKVDETLQQQQQQQQQQHKHTINYTAVREGL
jgi:hypothetical protein